MTERNQREQGRSAAPDAQPRRARREDAAADFLPGALDRTLGMEGVRRRRTGADSGTPPGGRP
jgi:hypothetical protein